MSSTGTDSPHETRQIAGRHEPVLLSEVVDILSLERPCLILDGTFGGGGHSVALLEAMPECSLVGLDRDPSAAVRAEGVSKRFGERFRFVAMSFSRIGELSEEVFDGVLFDFGVSSFQLDELERGFSFRRDAPADMRMNPAAGEPAHEFLETASRDALVQAIRDYGEEPRWRRVVDAIERARGTGQLRTTVALAKLIETAIGSRRKRFGGPQIHAATQSFQGIRIAVNDELGEIEAAIPAAFAKLRPGGVLAAISFHSLEDRIVKRSFNRFAGRPTDRSDSRPADDRPVFADLLFRKPLTPSASEMERNPRSRSARLRALRKR